MKSITIRQPWASAIALDHANAKRIENRVRPTSYRGLVAIHAGKTPDVAADRDPRIVRLFGRDPRVGMPVGAVIAVAELIDCHQAVWEKASQLCCAPWGEDYLPRAWHLVLDNVRCLPQPVPARGALSVPWTLPADVAAQVEAQLAEAVTR
ncbi:hypothetical protein ACIBCR_14835 [Micromonospora echinospora]|uniref:hypothetical protein n=1 Tax=Micromonospora echinospora TaxID=1877 RepID=UPI0037AE5BA7